MECRQSLGHADGTDGAGLQPCEALDEALERIASTGEVRAALGRAVLIYARHVGRENVDISALAERLAETALEHRSAAEVRGYGLKSLVRWWLGKAPSIEAIAAEVEVEAEELPSPAEAAGALDAALRAFVTEGLEYLPEPGRPVPHHGIKAVAGLGKTSQLLRILAEVAAGHTVWYVVPTHALGEEVAEQSRALGMPSIVIKGRSRPDGSGDPDRHMCRKSDVAEAVAGAGLDVWRTMCEDKQLKHAHGVPYQCEYFSKCRYVKQFADTDGKIVIMSHNYLTLPKVRLAHPSLIVVDERLHPAVIRGKSFPADRLDRPLDPHPEIDRTRHAETAKKAKAALWAGEHPCDHGLTQADLDAAAKAENKVAEPAYWPTPPMAPAQQKRLAIEYRQKSEGRAFAKAYRLLAEDFDREAPSQRVHTAKGIEWKGELQDRTFLHWQAPIKLPADVPALLIDADLDPMIADRLLPLQRIAVRWLPSARISHPWAQRRFVAKHPRWEPSALAAHGPGAQGETCVPAAMGPKSLFLTSPIGDQESPRL